MNRRSFLNWAGLLIATGGMIAAWYFAGVARAAGEAAAEMRREQYRAEVRARALEQQVDVSRLLPPVGGVKPDAPAAAAARLNALFAERLNPTDPAKQAANQATAVRRYKAALPLDHFALYRAAGWSTELIAKFEDVLAEHEGRSRDISETARAQGLSLAKAPVAALVQEENERFAAALRDAVGEDGQMRYEEFRKETVTRRLVGQLTGALMLTATPLEPAQAQQLATVFRANGFARDGSDRALKEAAFARSGGNVPSGDRVAWDAVLVQARAFLAPAQFEELQAQAQLGTHTVEAGTELSQLIEADRKAKTRSAPPSGD